MHPDHEPDGSIIGKVLMAVSAPIIVGASGLFLQQQANFARLDERLSQMAADVQEIKSDTRQQWMSLDSRVRQLEIGYRKAGF
jgi:predicted regulator of Ras-like GTPase activity (Roadblock/LC7/MglB family)